MTRRDFMRLHHPRAVGSLYNGGVCSCPEDYPDLCKADPAARQAANAMGCKIPGAPIDCCKCWDAEIPETIAETTEGVAIERIRAQILNEARNIICSDRNRQYGEPEDNFAVIGELWSQYLRRAKDADIDLNGYDVGMLMALFKVGRLETGTPKRDNFVDLAGYVACAAEIALKEEHNNDK